MIALWILLGSALGATISGVITDESGDPAAGVYVAGYDLSLRQVGVDGPTGPDGRYTMEVPAGRIRVRVVPGNEVDLVEDWLPGAVETYCDATVFDVAESDAEDAAAMALLPGLSVTGVVRDPDGEPLVGAEIEARPALGSAGIQPRRAITRSDGSFTVVGLPADYAWALRVEADDLPVQWLGGAYASLSGMTAEGEAGEQVDLGEFTLLPGISVSGQVSGPGGPLSNAVVTGYSEGQLVAVRADAEGRYALSGLPPGDLIAWVDGDGHARAYWPDNVLPGPRQNVPDEGTHVTDFDLVAPIEAVVQGRLTGVDELGGISVLLVHESGALGIGNTTRADGTFEIDTLPPGTWNLRVRGDEQGITAELIGGEEVPTAWTTTEGGVTTVEAAVQPAVTFEGVVLGADGEPAIDALVTVRERGTDVRRETRVLSDGSYLFGGLPGGHTWDLWAEGDPPCPNDPGRVRLYYEDEPYFARRMGLALVSGDRVIWDTVLPDDADRDGMDDAWERDWGLDPTRRDADLDPDGDGLENLVEYWLDEDPLAAPTRCSTGPGPGGAAGWGLALGFLLLVRRKHPAPDTERP